MEKKQKIKVNRTKEGTVFEIAFVMLAVIVWALIIWMLCKAPDVVATHFDGRGHPNGYGSPWGLVIPCVITTVVGAGLLLVAYHPHLINMPVEMKTPRQYELGIRSTRVAALTLLLLTLSIPCSLLLFESPTSWPVLGTVGLLLAVAVYYSVRIYKAK
ncbi:MAG: DUF1648 domain-containing protein [Prevotella sp.]|nr:DUF1648 domain-containing protein [Prevotella sp.]